MSKPAEPAGTMRLLVDFGPLVVFFATYKLAGAGLHAVLVATGAFMAAVVISTFAALITFRRITPMLWLSTILIVSFGAITLHFKDARFIEMKPQHSIMSPLLFCFSQALFAKSLCSAGCSDRSFQDFAKRAG